MTWERVQTADYPKIYGRFEGKLREDGTKRQYWVQDLTVDLTDDALNGFARGFLRDEILCKYSKVESEETIAHLGDFHRENFKKKMSLVCLTKDEQGKIRVAGLNAMYVSQKDDKTSDDQEGDKVLQLIKYVYSRKDPFEELNITEYLTAVGLYVFPEFRGEGVGQQILNARKLLCKDLGIGASLTIFTSYISQAMATKAGFKEFVTIDYDKFPEHLIIPKIQEHTKSAKYMYILY